MNELTSDQCAEELHAQLDEHRDVPGREDAPLILKDDDGNNYAFTDVQFSNGVIAVTLRKLTPGEQQA